jgi:hypothetical protein
VLTSIVTRLKTGTIKNVIPFGSARPKPPYVVVNPQPDPLDRGWRIQISAHYLPSQQFYLWDYVTDELISLLDEYRTVDYYSNDNRVLTEQERSGIIADNDDGTISMSRTFLYPSRTF